MSEKLNEKAMLVSLSIRQWTATKYDRKVSAEVASAHNTTLDAGRYNKALIAKDAIQTVQKIVGECRTYHYFATLPWQDNGARILPGAMFAEYSAKMREYRAKFDSAAADFIRNYPDLVTDARRRLNGLFDAADYPVNISDRFAFGVGILPLPDEADFRVNLSDAEIDAIRADIAQTVTGAQNAAVADIWTRLYDTVKHMIDRLEARKADGGAAIFRDSLITNLIELCDVLPRLNITADPALDTARNEIASRLCKYTPETLRQDEASRTEAIAAARDILQTIESRADGRTADVDAMSGAVNEIFGGAQ
jgi:hypothetical protein